MHNVTAVGRVERIGNLNAEVQELFDFERVVLDLMLKRDSIQKLHGDEGLRALFPYVIDGTYMGMIQGRGGLRLASKAQQRLRSLATSSGRNLSATKR